MRFYGAQTNHAIEATARPDRRGRTPRFLHAKKCLISISSHLRGRGVNIDCIDDCSSSPQGREDAMENAMENAIEVIVSSMRENRVVRGYFPIPVGVN
jgi:hypothetical protein